MVYLPPPLSLCHQVFGYLAIERLLSICRILVFAFSRERPTRQKVENIQRAGSGCKIIFREMIFRELVAK